MSIFFWIIILSLVIPAAMRYYRRSVQNKNRDQGMPGGFGGFPGTGPGPGQSNQPRDGFTQRDYYGGFGQLNPPQPPTGQQYPGNQYPAGQPYPGNQYPGNPAQSNQFPAPQPPVPYEDSEQYRNNPPRPAPQPQGSNSPQDVPPVLPPSSNAQGYRARKLAELDQMYSNGELAMEDYMARRAEIMKG
ncbi:hypothetical protein ABC337_02340 [Arthrobacter sp. 1P04PC]|uniref:hypothetical protein n=1 Tax=unclassified Arthrobacter TaxID=235627 RepID=UPI00399F3EA0